MPSMNARLEKALRTVKRSIWMVPPLRQIRRQQYLARQARFASESRAIDADLLPILADLQSGGAAVVRAEQLATVLGPDAADIVREMRAMIDSGGLPAGSPPIQSDALLTRSLRTYAIGLHERVLDLAEAYLGDHCFYLGATVKREPADGVSRGTRQWHIDREDERMLRIIIYLSDVDAGCGPFEYVEAPLSAQAAARHGYKSGLVSDARMESLVDRTEWNAFTGKSGDAIIFDGCNIFHRAQPPTTTDRLALTLSWSSRNPLEIHRTGRLSQANRSRLLAGRSPRIQASVPPAAIG